VAKLIYLYNKDMNMVAVFSNSNSKACPYFNDELRETLPNGYYSLEFDCPATHPTANLIEVEGYVATRNREGVYLMSRITELRTKYDNEGKKITTVLGEGISLELIDAGVVRPVSFLSYTATQLLEHCLQNTGWQVGNVDWVGTTDLSTEDYTTPLAYVHLIAEKFDSELRFRVELERGKVIGKYVDLIVRRGRNNGVRFEYEKNINGLERTINTQNLVTALVGIGRKEEVEEEESDMLTFESVEWRKSWGDPADKTPGADWVGDDEALELWGNDGRHKFGVHESEATDPDELLEETWNELQKRNEPQFTYEIDLLLMERISGYEQEGVRLGDTIIIKDKSFKPEIIVSARVTELVTSSDPEKEKAELSNFIPIELNYRSIVTELQRLINRRQLVWETTGAEIHQGPTPPDSFVTNTLWIDTTEALNVLKRYNGTYWVKVTPTEAAEIGAATPEQVEEKAEIAALRNQRQRLYEEKMKTDAAFSKLHNDENLQAGAVKTELQSAKLDFDDKHAAVITAINTAIADGELTEAEETAIANAVTAYEGTIPRLEEGMREAQAAIVFRIRQLAAQDAADFTEEYAERKITQGQTAPFGPEEFDLWIDTAYNPPVWKRYISGQWVKFTRTNFNELMGQVATSMIENQAITGALIADLAVNADKLAANSVITDKLSASAVTTVKLADLSVSEDKLAHEAVTAVKVAPQAITETKIADDSISTPKLQTESITTNKLDALAVTAEKIAANAITAVKINANAVTADKINANAVTADKIAANAVTTAKLEANAVTADKIAAGAIETDKLAANAVTADKIEGLTITANEIATNAITAAKINAGAVTANKIASNAVTTIKLNAGAVTADKIAANTITANEIASGTITTDLISAAGIDAGVITTGTLNANRIGAGSITTAKISASGISASVITTGTMNFERLSGGVATFGGAGNGYGSLQVVDADDEVVVDISSGDGTKSGFAGLTVGSLVVGDTIDAPGIVYKNDESYQLHVRTTDGSDDNSGMNWTNALYSINEAVDRVPDMNHGEITIMCSSQTDLYENVVIAGKNGGGGIILDLNGRTLHGRILAVSNSIRVVVQNGTVSNTGSAAVIDNEGSIYFNLAGITINGNGNSSHGLRTWRGGTSIVGTTEVYNVGNGFFNTSLGRLYITSTKGYGTDYGVRTTNGGTAHYGTTTPGGGISDRSSSSSGLEVGTSTTDLGSAIPPSPPVTEVTQTWSATASRSWRDVYNHWRSDTTQVYQGEWNGFGRHKGCWFFGTGMRNTLQGKTIKRVRVRVRRASAGGNNTVGANFVMHQHASQPGGEPTMSSTAHNVNFSWSERKWVTLPSSFHSLFSSGTWYGIGLYTSSRANSNYAYFTTACDVEVTYE
jgi:phage minor structural protein